MNKKRLITLFTILLSNCVNVEIKPISTQSSIDSNNQVKNNNDLKSAQFSTTNPETTIKSYIFSNKIIDLFNEIKNQVVLGDMLTGANIDDTGNMFFFSLQGKVFYIKDFSDLKIFKINDYGYFKYFDTDIQGNGFLVTTPTVSLPEDPQVLNIHRFFKFEPYGDIFTFKGKVSNSNGFIKENNILTYNDYKNGTGFLSSYKLQDNEINLNKLGNFTERTFFKTLKLPQDLVFNGLTLLNNKNNGFLFCEKKNESGYKILKNFDSTLSKFDSTVFDANNYLSSLSVDNSKIDQNGDGYLIYSALAQKKEIYLYRIKNYNINENKEIITFSEDKAIYLKSLSIDKQGNGLFLGSIDKSIVISKILNYKVTSDKPIFEIEVDKISDIKLNLNNFGDGFIFWNEYHNFTGKGEYQVNILPIKNYLRAF